MGRAIAHPVDLVPSSIDPDVYCIPISNADGTPVGSNLADIGVTASADELNTLDGITSSTTELNYSHGSTPGASVADVVLVAGAGRELPTGLVENVVTKGADYPVVAADSDKIIIVTAADKIMTLPSTVLGLRFTFVLAATGLSAGTGLQIAPAALDQIIGDGFTPADNKAAILAGASDRAGDMIEVIGDGNLGWYITRVIGTWARAA